jgi:hypothetical protein
LSEHNNSDNFVQQKRSSSQEFSCLIRDWSLLHKIDQGATSDLLKILKTHICFGHFPSDSRTLLHTPTITDVRTVSPGEYCHFGIQKGIISIFPTNFEQEVILVQFNVDGLPLHKSTNNQFWPILGRVKGIESVFVVGIYEGNSKPNDFNDFLKDFIEEAVDLESTGINFNGQIINFVIEGFICDAPARAELLKIKSHSGYYSCGKCTVKGKYVENRVVLLNTCAEFRTNDSFRNQVQPKHHNGNSDLTKLSVDLVKCFPFEYMHLVCLGVTKKLLKLWIRGKVSVFRLSPKIVEKLSIKLVKVGKSLPIEHNRKQRSLREVDRWKATEFRSFLLYTGPIALKKYLPEKHYNLFMCLSVSIRLLATPHPTLQNINYAESLLKYFIEEFRIIYGKVNVSYNIHGLNHL